MATHELAEGGAVGTNKMGDRANVYAILPAAGRSERMGQSKLLLPWPTEANPQATMLGHVLGVWSSSRVRQTVVVIRNDAPTAVREICASYPVATVVADDPVDMKASCLAGVRYLAKTWNPVAADRFFICPVDIPGITRQIIDRLVKEADRLGNVGTAFEGNPAVVPTFQGRRGHPALLPWTWAGQIAALSPSQGINLLLDRGPVIELACCEPSRDLDDLDTPDQYFAARRRLMGDRASPTSEVEPPPVARSGIGR